MSECIVTNTDVSCWDCSCHECRVLQAEATLTESCHHRWAWFDSRNAFICVLCGEWDEA